MPEQVTISRRSRNLGFGWTSTPERTGPNEYPRIKQAPPPGVYGGPATLRRQMDEKSRILGPTAWHSWDLFVAGRRVIPPPGSDPLAYADELRWMIQDLVDTHPERSRNPQYTVTIEDTNHGR